MQELDLPHCDPIRFAKHIISKTLDKAVVQIEFKEIPTFAMMIEASAQSSSALSDASVKKGYLVSLKNVELLQKPTKNSFEVEVINQNRLGNMNSIAFNVFEDKKNIVTGSFVIATD